MNTQISTRCMGCMSPIGDELHCSHCGYDNSGPYDSQYIKPGDTLDSRYQVGRLARGNGESATYVGYDTQERCRVFIREYFPHTLAARDASSGEVAPKEGCGAQYKTLMSDFIDICNEVKRLSVTEPVVPIDNVFADRGTVYAVYRDLHLTPLETYLDQQGGKLPWLEARELILPLLNALSNIHDRSDIHRGISPYTVYVNRAGELSIWDFCMSAARTGGSELEAELFSGYAAPEQYVSNGWQGTWTDVYAVAALFYRMVSGFVPPKATVVSEQRPLTPLVDLVMDLPQHISDAVMDAMEQRTDRRTQEIGTFTSHLLETSASSTAVYDTNVVNEVKRKREARQMMRAEKRRRGISMALGLLITVLFLGGVGWFVMSTYFPDLVSRGDSGGSMRPAVSDGEEETEDSTEGSTEGESDSMDASGAAPSFIGMDVDQVENDVAYKGRFRFEIQYVFSDEHEEGVIIEQTPPEGTVMADNRNVILTVSKGRENLTMPSLVGLTRQQAEAEMDKLIDAADKALQVNFFSRYVEGAEAGTVTSTTPAGGTEFDPKETTRIVVFYASASAESASDSSSSSGGGGGGPSGPMTAEELQSLEGFEPLREKTAEELQAEREAAEAANAANAEDGETN